MNTQLVYLGLGANLGDPIEQIVQARSRLGQISEVTDLRCSPLYASSPVGYDEQADFINCVVALHYQKTPADLLSTVQGIESNLGRVRDVSNQNAPRHIDIDILWFAGLHREDAQLTLPHPRWQDRLFVILPWLDVVHEELKPLLLSSLEQGYFNDQKIHKLGFTSAH